MSFLPGLYEEYTANMRGIRIVSGPQEASIKCQLCLLFYPTHLSHRPGIMAMSCCSLCQDDAPAHASPFLIAKTWGRLLGCPFREKPRQVDFMNCSHFPSSRLMTRLPTVSSSVVAANDFNPLHVSFSFASEKHSEQQDCFNSHSVLMMSFKCIKRISKYQTGGL